MIDNSWSKFNRVCQFTFKNRINQLEEKESWRENRNESQSSSARHKKLQIFKSNIKLVLIIWLPNLDGAGINLQIAPGFYK